MVSEAVCARTSVHVFFTRERGDKGCAEKINKKTSIYQRNQDIEVLFFLRANL